MNYNFDERHSDMWTRSFTTLIKHADDRKGRLLASARSFPEGTGIPYFSELLTLDSEFGEQGNQIGAPVQGGMTLEQCLISSGEADLVSVLDGNEMESMRSGPARPSAHLTKMEAQVTPMEWETTFLL